VFPIPHIQIHQQYAKIGIDADLGKIEMKQPRPTMEIQQPRASITMKQPRGEMKIDQSAAWDALARTPILEVMNRIYSSARQVALEGIAKIVDKGNRLAAIHESKGANVIAELARDDIPSFPEMQYAGEASPNNVHFSYVAHKPEVDIQANKVEIHTEMHKPEVNYIRGKLDIYVKQAPSIEITPPQIDMRA
jgi:hypothetical protein